MAGAASHLDSVRDDTVRTGETSAPPSPRKRRPARKRNTRKPVRKVLVLTHRWSALVLGLVLVIVCTSGAALVYAPEMMRALNGNLLHGTHSPQPVGFETAEHSVQSADPRFHPTQVSLKNDVYIVTGDQPASGEQYFVDAGTGKINGHANLYGGVIGFLVNLHDCGLTCQGYAGYQPWLARPSVIAHVPWFAGMTWGAVILGGTGLLLLGLAVGGAIIWWPGRKRLRHGFRVRFGRGRFARDYDLHNVIGIIATPALLVWALTGMNFEIPQVSKLWYSATGGRAVADDAYTMTASGTGPEIALPTAAAAARAHFPNSEITAVGLPAAGQAYYTFTLFDHGANGSNADLWKYYPTYSGNRYLGVDEHDASNVKVMTGPPKTLSNKIINDLAQPTLHYGVSVNPWWRAVWFVFGLTPLALMVTGMSTWLVRRRTSRNKKARVRSAASTS
ncbi:PepSY-associated TM helix domain-containing protein [Jongsikchunia kroppenstedtii]|uniref:PepSY-associated TM helix domain-containing protein n=1 Tax=Jongsikchunia kroppenstedtii TaxID=1121721 RepID=UPI00038017F8|nr:PepSY-associated TM helix domain-containing protein [Jongsikchunia kroppenstedtii]